MSMGQVNLHGRSTRDRWTSKVQTSKALAEISVIFPAVTLDKEVHPAKAKSSTRTTDSGMSSEVNELQR